MEDEGENSNATDTNESEIKQQGRLKNETLTEKKDRKKAVKTAQAEKRKTKVKKYIKKRKEQQSNKK